MLTLQRPTRARRDNPTGQSRIRPGPQPGHLSHSLPKITGRGRLGHVLGGPGSGTRDQAQRSHRAGASNCPVSSESDPVAPESAGPPSGRGIPDRQQPAARQGRTQKTRRRRVDKHPSRYAARPGLTGLGTGGRPIASAGSSSRRQTWFKSARAGSGGAAGLAHNTHSRAGGSFQLGSARYCAIQDKLSQSSSSHRYSRTLPALEATAKYSTLIGAPK